MTEEFLHYLWKFRLISGELRTVSGERVEVIRPGDHNHDSGPDFLDARIRVGKTLWAGNVEVHVKGSDWYQHGHDSDRAYDNIILHVVFEHDVQVTGLSGKPVETLVICGSYPESSWQRYLHFRVNGSMIPCGKLLPGIDSSCFDHWACSLATERLEKKIRDFRVTWEKTGYDWDLTFFRHLARSFGFHINSEPFEMLAASVPLKVLQLLKGDLFRLESILFGQSGLLSCEFAEPYPAGLKWEYNHLQKKYSLQPLPGFLWKFLRLRPSNFPTVRIAQLAALINGKKDLFSAVISSPGPDAIAGAFSVQASGYWDDHYHFSKVSSPFPKVLGKSSVNLLMVNFVVPFLFFYGKEKEDPDICERALTWLESLPAEENAELRRWRTLGLDSGNALRAQALMELKGKYCDRKKCLECRLGNVILSGGKP